MRTVIPTGTLLPEADGTTPRKPRFRLKRGVAVRISGPHTGPRLVRRFAAVAEGVGERSFEGYGETVTLAINNLLPDLVHCFHNPAVADACRRFANNHVGFVDDPRMMVLKAGTPVPPDGDGGPVRYQLSKGVLLGVKESTQPERHGKWTAYVPGHFCLGGFGETAAEAVADALRMLGVMRTLGRDGCKPEVEAYDYVRAHLELVPKEDERA